MVGTIYTHLGVLVRQRRDALGLTQSELASRTRLARTSVTMIERGGQSLLVHQLVAIELALRMKPGDLLIEAVKRLHQQSDEPEAVEDLTHLLSGLNTAVGRITRR